MALSGSISSPPVTFGNYIRLDWERIATNTTNRTSTIRYRLYLVLVTGSWVDATESFSISTMDGSSNGSRGVTYRGPGGTHLIHEYTNTVTHYDGNPVTLGAMATLRSGWNQLGTVMTDFGTWTLDAMAMPGAPNTKYWVGGTGTWDNTAGSKWSTSPGGAGGASVPQPNEDVVISGAGTVTLGIDTPAVRQLTVGAPINLNGKTVTCARAQFNMQNFSLGSATINAYNSISFSTQTIDLGTGTLRVTHGSPLTIGGSPYAGGFHVSPWTTTVTAGTSLIEVNVNPGTGNSMDVVLGAHTYNIMRIIIGGASTGAVSAAISGSPTFKILDVRSATSAAHTVNFNAGSSIKFDKFVAIGSSTSNRLTFDISGATGDTLNDYAFITPSGASSTSYGRFVKMGGMGDIYANDPAWQDVPAYIGSSSIYGGSYNEGWLLQDPPKISTLVDPLTTAPGSNPNWTVTGTVTQVATGHHGGGYTGGDTGESHILSTGTYDMIDSELVWERMSGGYYGDGTPLFINKTPDSSSADTYSGVKLYELLAGYSDGSTDSLNAIRYKDYLGSEYEASASNPGGNDPDYAYARYSSLKIGEDGTVTYKYSPDGATWTTMQGVRNIDTETLPMFRSVRIGFGNIKRTSPTSLDGQSIGSINPSLVPPNNANFLQFFGGL